MDNTWALLSSAMRSADTPRALTRGTVKRVARFARPHGVRLLIFLILTVVSAVLAVTTPVLAGKVVDAIVGGHDLSVVLWLAGVIALLAVADAGLGLAERWQSARIGEGIILDLRVAVFEHVQKLPIAFFTRTRTGALVSRLNNDVIGAQRTFTATLSGLVTNVIQLLLSLAVMVTLSWQVTAVALVLLPVFVLPARRLGRRMAGLQREAAQLNAGMTTQMTERFSAPGATLVKLFGHPRQEVTDFAGRAGRVRDIGVRTAMLTRWFMTSLTLVSALAQALVYGLGGYLALTGQLEPGTVVALALLLTRLYAPLTALANVRVDVMTAMVSFERVFEVLDLDPMIKEPAEPKALPAGGADAAGAGGVGVGGVGVGAGGGGVGGVGLGGVGVGGVAAGGVAVEFEDVRFGYPAADRFSLASLEDVATLDARGGEEVLHGISFRAEPGQMVALVGSSGAGKSTIASLLPRLYDVDAGSVRLSGVDVRDLEFATLRETVGVVTQDGHLFHDTIRANLSYARPGVTDDEIWAALEQARLGELVHSLPDGLDTTVGERGYRLSGGERQRLTIARLLLAQPKVVVLDEATAHLDSESEAAVGEALIGALEGRTSLVIAHRLSTIRAADLILVIEHGTVVEQGTHEELLAREGRYAELHHTQFDDEPAVA